MEKKHAMKVLALLELLEDTSLDLEALNAELDHFVELDNAFVQRDPGRRPFSALARSRSAMDRWIWLHRTLDAHRQNHRFYQETLRNLVEGA